MEFTAKTRTLQELVGKAIKGASNNKMIPITSLMQVESKENELILTTTNAMDTLVVKDKLENAKDLKVTVQADLFSKLVSKMTSENITLKLEENVLKVKGNGEYSLELLLDENGKPIQFPEIEFTESNSCEEIALTDIKAIIASNKKSLAETMEMPCLIGYYFGDTVISTDSFKVCSNSKKIFTNPILLGAETLELVSLCEMEKITFFKDNNKILFKTAKTAIYGSLMDGIDNYPIDAIKDYLNSEFSCYFEINKAKLVNILDRIALFVSPYDDNTVNLTFTEQGILISNKKSNSSELLACEKAGNFRPFKSLINLELLLDQLNSQPVDAIKLWYGHDRAIKLESDSITHIVALSGEEV